MEMSDVRTFDSNPYEIKENGKRELVVLNQCTD